MENTEPIVNIEGEPVEIKAEIEANPIVEVKTDPEPSSDVEVKPIIEDKPLDETLIKQVVSQELFEDVKSVTSDFIKSLSAILEDKTLLDKYNVKLSDHLCKVFKELISKNPIVLEGLKISIEKSLEDGKIDITEFLKLFQEFYKNYYKFGLRGEKKQSKAVICGVIFKFLIEYIYTIDEVKKHLEALPKLLETIDKIIDIGVAMIDVKKELKKTSIFFSCF